MKKENWEELFREMDASEDGRHDPDTHRAYSDWLQDQGDEAGAEREREAAAFWAWALGEGLAPDVRTPSWGDMYAWKDSEMRDKQAGMGLAVEDREPSSLPKRVYDELEPDSHWNTPEQASLEGIVMWWPSRAEAWGAAFRAWVKAKQKEAACPT